MKIIARTDNGTQIVELRNDEATALFVLANAVNDAEDTKSDDSVRRWRKAFALINELADSLTHRPQGLSPRLAIVNVETRVTVSPDATESVEQT